MLNVYEAGRPLSRRTALAVCAAPAFVAADTPLWLTMPEPPPLPEPDLEGLAASDDADLYYAVFNGRGRRPVILLHEGLASSDYWGFEVPRLMKHRKVVVLDTRGHGRSRWTGGRLSYALLARDLLTVMDVLQLPKAALVGAGDGGNLALLMALHHRSRVTRIATWAANYDGSGWLPPSPHPALSGSTLLATLAARYRRSASRPDGFPALASAVTKMSAEEPKLAAGDLARIETSVLIAAGEREQFIAPAHTRRLAEMIPRAQLVFLPGVSHAGPQQNPQAFHQMLQTFLDRRA